MRAAAARRGGGWWDPKSGERARQRDGRGRAWPGRVGGGRGAECVAPVDEGMFLKRSVGVLLGGLVWVGGSGRGWWVQWGKEWIGLVRGGDLRNSAGGFSSRGVSVGGAGGGWWEGRGHRVGGGGGGRHQRGVGGGGGEEPVNQADTAGN